MALKFSNRFSDHYNPQKLSETYHSLKNLYFCLKTSIFVTKFPCG